MFQRSYPRKSLPGRPSIVPNQKMYPLQDSQKENIPLGKSKENSTMKSTSVTEFQIYQSNNISQKSFTATFNTLAKELALEKSDSKPTQQTEAESKTNSKFISYSQSASHSELEKKFEQLTVDNVLRERTNHTILERRYSMIPQSSTKIDAAPFIRPFQTPHQPARKVNSQKWQMKQALKTHIQPLQIYEEDNMDESADIKFEDQVSQKGENLIEKVDITALSENACKKSSGRPCDRVFLQSDEAPSSTHTSHAIISNGMVVSNGESQQSIQTNNISSAITSFSNHTSNTVEIHHPTSISNLVNLYLQDNVNGINDFMEEMKRLDEKLNTINLRKDKITDRFTKPNTRKRKASNRTPRNKKHMNGSAISNADKDIARIDRTPSMISKEIELSTPSTHLNSHRRKKRKTSYTPLQDVYKSSCFDPEKTSFGDESPKRTRTPHFSARKRLLIETSEDVGVHRRTCEESASGICPTVDLSHPTHNIPPVFELDIGDSPLHLEPLSQGDDMNDNEAQVNFLMDKLSSFASNMKQSTEEEKKLKKYLSSNPFLTEVKQCVDQLDSSMSLCTVISQLKEKCPFLFEEA